MLRVTGLCAGNSPEAGEFPAQMASNTEKVSIWWCHHVSAKYVNINNINSHSVCMIQNDWSSILMIDH